MVEKMSKDWGFDPVPEESRLPWYRISAIWAGAVICVPAFIMGGLVAQGMRFIPGLIVIFLGYLFVALLIGIMGLIGSKHGTPTAIVAANSFGTYGSRFLVSLMIGIGLGGWFGVQTVVMASSFNLIVSSLSGFSIPLSASIIFWGIVVAGTALIGYNAIAWLGWITVPLLLLLSIWGLAVGVSNYGGWNEIFNFTPAQPFSWVLGFTIMVGWFAAGICVAPDIQRYGKPTFLNSFKASAFGVVPAGLLLTGTGAVMAIAAKNPDLTAAMSKIGLGVPGLILLILATWTTNVLNVYSGGLAITNIFGLKSKDRTKMTIILAAIGVLLGLIGIMERLQPFLIVLTILLPPYMGVVIADYFVLKRHDVYHNPISWPAVIAWGAGALTATFVKLGIPFINGIIVSFVLFLVLFRTLPVAGIGKAVIRQDST
jgi:cytosine permease